MIDKARRERERERVNIWNAITLQQNVFICHEKNEDRWKGRKANGHFTLWGDTAHLINLFFLNLSNVPWLTANKHISINSFSFPGSYNLTPVIHLLIPSILNLLTKGEVGEWRKQIKIKTHRKLQLGHGINITISDRSHLLGSFNTIISNIACILHCEYGGFYSSEREIAKTLPRWLGCFY